MANLNKDKPQQDLPQRHLPGFRFPDDNDPIYAFPIDKYPRRVDFPKHNCHKVVFPKGSRIK